MIKKYWIVITVMSVHFVNANLNVQNGRTFLVCKPLLGLSGAKRSMDMFGMLKAE